MTIEEIRKLLAAITPVWERADICVGGGGEVRPVVEFITKAPEIVAFLLGEVERLRAAWDREYGDPYGDPRCSVCGEYFDNYRCACDSVDLNTKAPAPLGDGTGEV